MLDQPSTGPCCELTSNFVPCNPNEQVVYAKRGARFSCWAVDGTSGKVVVTQRLPKLLEKSQGWLVAKRLQVHAQDVSASSIKSTKHSARTSCKLADPQQLKQFSRSPIRQLRVEPRTKRNKYCTVLHNLT